MGLDAVELLMDVEDHFGITIQDSESASTFTVGDLVAIIQKRTNISHEKRCFSLLAFLKLRRCVRDITRDDNFRLRPRDPVVQYLAQSDRRELWDRLGSLLGTRPRDLRRPRWLRMILNVLTTALLLLAVSIPFSIDIAILPLALAIAAVAILVLYWITTPFCTVPPDDWTTFGDISRKLVGVVAATKQTNLRSTDDILLELRPLIVNVLSVDSDEVVPDARFVEDLGVG